MKERPKIDFLKMSHPQFDSWEIFANQCYAHMDHLDQEKEELKAKTFKAATALYDLKTENKELREEVARLKAEQPHVQCDCELRQD